MMVQTAADLGELLAAQVAKLFYYLSEQMEPLAALGVYAQVGFDNPLARRFVLIADQRLRTTGDLP